MGEKKFLFTHCIYTGNYYLHILSICARALHQRLRCSVMKSVQMMLFATLRDLLPGPPAVRLVHAGRKTAGATGGDEGYTERKDMSEARVVAGFTGGKIVKEGGLAWFNALLRLNQKDI